MLVLSFLSQLGAVAELGVEIPQGRLILTSQEQDGTLFQIGRQTANGLTFAQAMKRKLSEPIAPIQVRQEIAKLVPSAGEEEGVVEKELVATAPVAPAPMPAASVPISTETLAEAEPVGISRLQRLSLSLPSEKVGQAPEPALQPAQEHRSGPRFTLRSLLSLG